MIHLPKKEEARGFALQWQSLTQNRSMYPREQSATNSGNKSKGPAIINEVSRVYVRATCVLIVPDDPLHIFSRSSVVLLRNTYMPNSNKEHKKSRTAGLTASKESSKMHQLKWSLRKRELRFLPQLSQLWSLCPSFCVNIRFSGSAGSPRA